MNNIGFKIKKLREQKYVSQENLALDLDISQSSLSRIENGNIEKIDFLFMQKTADYFNVKPDFFWITKLLLMKSILIMASSIIKAYSIIIRRTCLKM